MRHHHGKVRGPTWKEGFHWESLQEGSHHETNGKAGRGHLGAGVRGLQDKVEAEADQIVSLTTGTQSMWPAHTEQGPLEPVTQRGHRGPDGGTSICEELHGTEGEDRDGVEKSRW